MKADPAKRAATVLDQIAEAEPMAAKLRAVAAGERVAFENVVDAARGHVAAVVARTGRKRVWIVCPGIRCQETVQSELLNWLPEVLFFPEADAAPVAEALPNPEATAERLRIIEKLASGKGRQVVVLTRASLEERVPAPGALRRMELKLKKGARLDRDDLLKQLAGAGYEHVSQVSLRGQFAVRGGILDIFSFHHTLPVRLELFDDEIESIREFELDAQTSVKQLEICTLLLGDPEGEEGGGPAGSSCRLKEYIGKGDLTISTGADWLEAQVQITEGGIDAGEGEDFSTAFHGHGLGEFEAGDFVVDERKRERFFAQLGEWQENGWTVHIVCNNEGEIERLHDLIPPARLEPVRFGIGSLAAGFVFPAGRLAVLSDAELFGRYRHTRARRVALQRAREIASRGRLDTTELTEGELVVHLEHGIGRFEGMRTIPRDGIDEEVLVVAFANDARVYVPLEQGYVLSRYIGIGKRNPPLSALGDARWSKAKKSAEKAVFDYAGALLQVHAERETAQGHAFPPDSKWQSDFESSFLYKETPDQLAAIAATKIDMESVRPMDRLICGDVGFGKTEVAIRAAFKAVMGGKQVAILCPTTVLAQQHYQNFRERMSDYPVTVDTLSRFRSAAEQRKTVEGLREGSVDIVIGTHRLISQDVQYKDLGLVVIDEEQRFGVRHKERFKEMFRLVDLLTLSATPIPRTLYLSLMGAKDMSTLETAPPNRIPVETTICAYDERVIRDAIKRELARQGQVFFLHNRVGDIDTVRQRIATLVPGARIAVGHGQMDEDELEEVMQRFIDGEADVLIATTIIESGIDIPNANTIIIDRADRFGLADLYQLRGRVGRAQTRAYAYLMLPRDMMTVGEARKRINAIKQYSSLGAGFKIAMRDLEIRGAGNILGTQQSGHIVSIGFDLYCSLLKQAISRLKGERVTPRREVLLRLDFVATREADYLGKPEGLAPAFLPVSYISEPALRIQAYRSLSELSTQEQLDGMRKSWRDRFGPLPEAVDNLVALSELRLSAGTRRFSVVEVKDSKVMLTRGGELVVIGNKFPRLTAEGGTARLAELLKMVRSF